MTPAAKRKAPPAGARASSSALATGSLTLRGLIDTYMARAYDGRDRTRPTHLKAWDELLGRRAFAQISDDHVFRALEQLRAQPARVYAGRAAGERIFRAKRGLRSSSTINRYHMTLQALFTWAIKQRLAPRGFENPARKIERAPEKNAVVRFLSDEERVRLLEACRASAWPRLYLIVLMALTTGARRGELLALTWNDIDLERAIAHVRTSKNDNPRALPLVPAVLEELRRFAGADLRSCVFPSRSRLSEPRHFESSWHAALERAKIERFRFHDCRHSCASFLAQSGASILEIADVLGHKQLEVTRRYSHLCTATKAKLIDRVLGGIK